MNTLLKCALLSAAYTIIGGCGGGKTPDKIVGDWQDEQSGWILSIRADGTIVEIEKKRGPGEPASWTFDSGDPGTLKILDEGHVQAQMLVKFVNGDMMELTRGNSKLLLKRIR